MKISLYPLYYLDSDLTSPVEIDNGVSIVINEININKINRINVSKEDAHHIKQTRFCLSIDEETIKPEKSSLLFILACRLLKRTKIFIRYRVNSANMVAKVRDDYPFVTAWNATTLIKANEFKIISKLYKGLKMFSSLNKRTERASYFLSKAYRSNGWLESLIFYVCALETLTSASKYEKWPTEKFKTRIHNYVGYNKKKLDRIYNIRSMLVHGRYNYKSQKDNLKFNRMAETACKKVFTKILLTPEHLKAFANDSSRMKLF
jgi:hypothetical protein